MVIRHRIEVGRRGQPEVDQPDEDQRTDQRMLQQASRVDESTRGPGDVGREIRISKSARRNSSWIYVHVLELGYLHGCPVMVNCQSLPDARNRVPTHQEIAQVSDQELLQRMINSHDGRFDESFWSYFEGKVAPHLPESPVIADLGCGPGLFLRDLSRRLPDATLLGLDVTPTMLDYAGTLDYGGKSPEYRLCDANEGPLPLADSSVNLLTMVAVLHVLNDPIEMCREIRRILADNGIFLLQDWVRMPMPDYLDRMTGDVPEEARELARQRMLRLFPTHNKYTVEDWLWLLGQGGLDVMDYQELNSPHFRAFVCRAT